MKINDIKSPNNIKNLSLRQLNSLSKEIRAFIINSVSKTGGHLSSNLGVVELTVALHYVFDSPKDKLIFDVGHQTYTHKILTGRSDKFSTLRQWEGLSGFQKLDESEHDVWEAGHASTSLSAALGMAIARDLNQKKHEVIAIIGDASFGGGMSLEALNHLAELDKKVIIVLNDNRMSISKNSGPVSQMISSIRTSSSYVSLKQGVKSKLSHNNSGKATLKGLSGIRNTLKNSLLKKQYYTQMGIDYYGPIDGHNLHDLIHAFNAAKEKDGPVIVHVWTKKGKGYHPAEVDKSGIWHGVSSFDLATSKFKSEIPAGYLSWSKTVSNYVLELAKKDNDIVAITPAMTIGSALTDFQETFPERFFDCGIAEEHAVTMAAGLAISGKKPFLAIYSTFLQRAYDQINHDVTRMNLPVVFGIDRSGIVGEDGETHQGVFDIGILNPLPNIIIAMGRNSFETESLLKTAFASNKPFAIRFPKGTTKVNDSLRPELLEIGSWEVFGDPLVAKVIVITYGPNVDRICAKAHENKFNILIVNARFIKPLDKTILNKLLSTKLPIITYEEEMKTGGLSTNILEYINDFNFNNKIYRFGIDDIYLPTGSISSIKKHYKLDINSLFEKIKEFL